MAFEIHIREFFEAEDDADPEGNGPGQWGWRIPSIVVIAAIALGLAYLFIGNPAGALF